MQEAPGNVWSRSSLRKPRSSDQARHTLAVLPAQARSEFAERCFHCTRTPLALHRYPKLSLFGSGAVIGHEAPRQERCELIAHFREIMPGVPIVALLGRRDEAFSNTDFNWPADVLTD